MKLNLWTIFVLFVFLTLGNTVLSAHDQHADKSGMELLSKSEGPDGDDGSDDGDGDGCGDGTCPLPKSDGGDDDGDGCGDGSCPLPEGGDDNGNSDDDDDDCDGDSCPLPPQ